MNAVRMCKVKEDSVPTFEGRTALQIPAGTGPAGLRSPNVHTYISTYVLVRARLDALCLA
jgi:hypothetical protein